MGIGKAFGHAVRRLTSSNEDIESAQLRRDSARQGAQSVDTCRDRSKVEIRGTIASLNVQPVNKTTWLEAELNDGSGKVTLIWMGRTSVPGIEPGTTLRAKGLISCSGQRRIIFNPRYELLAPPKER